MLSWQGLVVLQQGFVGEVGLTLNDLLWNFPSLAVTVRVSYPNSKPVLRLKGFKDKDYPQVYKSKQAKQLLNDPKTNRKPPICKSASAFW